MRKTTVAALGVALTVGAGLAPATAAPSVADGSDNLVAVLKNLPRSLDGARGSTPAARASSADAVVAPDFYRIAGANRYETAVAVSEEMVCGPDVPADECWGLGGAADPVDVVFVANGLGFPDALGAGPLASGLGPLLLVPPTGTVPAVVMDEIERIAPEWIVIFGGTGAVSAGVESQLATLGEIDRVAGANRYETAAMATEINHQVLLEQDLDGDGAPDGLGLDTVVLAAGEGFADSLAGGGAAANSRGSLLLTPRSDLPDATRDALELVQAPEVIILGGTSVVSAAVETEVRATLPDAEVVRVAGANRFETANQLSERVFPAGAAELFLVNGYNFPDALASAPLAGYWGASTLLAQQSCVTTSTLGEAVRLDPAWVTALGGMGVVSDDALFLETC